MLTIRSHVNYRPASYRSTPLPPLASLPPHKERSHPAPCPDPSRRPTPANDDNADTLREVPLGVPFTGHRSSYHYPDPLDAPPVHPEHYVGSMELYEAGHARIVQQRTRERVHAPRDGRYTIYAILDPITGEAVYVGQTGNARRRRARHLTYWSGSRVPQPTLLISCWLALLGQSPLMRTAEAGTAVLAHGYRADSPPAPVFRTLGHADTLLEALEAETDWIERLGAARHRLLNGGYHRGAARQAWPGGVRAPERPAGRGEPHDREAEGGAGKGA